MGEFPWGDQKYKADMEEVIYMRLSIQREIRKSMWEHRSGHRLRKKSCNLAWWPELRAAGVVSICWELGDQRRALRRWTSFGRAKVGSQLRKETERKASFWSRSSVLVFPQSFNIDPLAHISCVTSFAKLDPYCYLLRETLINWSLSGGVK